MVLQSPALFGREEIDMSTKTKKMALYWFPKKISVKFWGLRFVENLFYYAFQCFTLVVADHNIGMLVSFKTACRFLWPFCIIIPIVVLSSIALCVLFMIYVSLVLIPGLGEWLGLSKHNQFSWVSQGPKLFPLLVCQSLKCVSCRIWSSKDWKSYHIWLICVSCFARNAFWTLYSPQAGPQTTCILLWHIFASKCLNLCIC